MSGAVYDVVVAGGGSAGCVLAARLSEEPGRTVCLLEAGPDYGPHDDGRWPPELLDAGGIPESHEWDPDESWYGPLRARVIGGCSAHNACLIVRGAPADYDAWGPGWTSAELAPYLDRAERTLAPEPRRFRPDEWSPWFATVTEACAARGLPLIDDFNDHRTPVGVGAGPFNIVGSTRWNAAFAYLDPARGRPNLTVRGEALVDRVLVDGGRAEGVELAGGERVAAGEVVLAAGAYGTPAILLRSGIGPEDELRRLGIPLVERLDGVGAGLADHVSAKLAFEPGDSLRVPTPWFANGEIKARTATCPDDLWDLHLLPVTSRSGERMHLTVIALQPASRGRVRLRSRDPGTSPEIAPDFLSDPAGRDLAALLDGLELVHELEATEPLRSLAQPVAGDDGELVLETLASIFHPVGTSRLGDDDGAVLDRSCRVRGVEGLRVADASAIPVLPRANTHLSVLALAERAAELP